MAFFQRAFKWEEECFGGSILFSSTTSPIKWKINENLCIKRKRPINRHDKTLITLIKILKQRYFPFFNLPGENLINTYRKSF